MSLEGRKKEGRKNNHCHEWKRIRIVNEDQSKPLIYLNRNLVCRDRYMFAPFTLPGRRPYNIPLHTRRIFGRTVPRISSVSRARSIRKYHFRVISVPVQFSDPFCAVTEIGNKLACCFDQGDTRRESVLLLLRNADGGDTCAVAK
jgi:hypothetical protein